VPIEIQMSAPVLKQPTSGTQVSAAPSGSVLLTWQSTVLTESYMLEISSDPGFRTREREERVASNLFMLKGLSPGRRYYWRVRSFASGHPGAWAKPSWFELQAGAP
jgi:hypothetical protein